MLCHYLASHAAYLHRAACALLVPLCFTATAHAARLALVIGNDEYSHVTPLKNARNDARLMAATLNAAGYEVVDGPRENVSGKAMWRALDQFRARIAKGDEVVFFFAGHGVQIGGSPVLLPIDIEAESDMQVEREGVKLYDLQDYFRDAKFALLVIDACRDNPFPRKPGSSRTIGDTRGLAPPAEAADGMAILMAASRGQRALDQVPGVTADNGLFTYELVQSLKNPGDDVVTALRDARDRVETKARQFNHAQRPALVDETRGRFYLFPATQASIANPPPTLPASPSQREYQGWEAARRAQTRAAYEAFLVDHPNGVFSSAARVAIASLPSPQASMPADQPTTPLQTTTPSVPAPQAERQSGAVAASSSTIFQHLVGQTWNYTGKNRANGNVILTGQNVLERKVGSKLLFSLGDVVDVDSTVQAMAVGNVVITAKAGSGVFAIGAAEKRLSGRAQVLVDYKRDQPAAGDLSWDRTVLQGNQARMTFTLYFNATYNSGAAEFNQKRMSWTALYSMDSPIAKIIDLSESFSLGRIENTLYEFTASNAVKLNTQSAPGGRSP